MKTPKQARHEAKQLFRECLKDGILDEAAARAAVQRVIQLKPRGYLAVLEHFQRLVKLDLDRRTARVESVQPLAPDMQEQIKSRLVGSDVYDGSVRARLDELQNAF
jgi:F-type H+-transporting ATPase subunit delta